MIKCKSCGKSISKKAKTCPQCGEPNKQTSGLTWLILFTIVVVIVFEASDDSSSTYTPTNNSKPIQKTKLNVDESKSAQSKRKELIGKLISEGIISKIEIPAALPHVYVTGKFYYLSFDDKESFIGLILAYYYTENNDATLIILKDYRTNKKIGTFSERGLDLD